MKEQLAELISSSLARLADAGVIDATAAAVAPQIDMARSPEHGDFAANTALVLAKRAGRPPREVAQLIVDGLEAPAWLEKVEIAGPGFLNFHVAQTQMFRVIEDVLDQGENFGRVTGTPGQRINIEFVSANPTGPLHIGHGRGAAYGDALANLLSAAGAEVSREYYVNDAGRQMDILAASVLLRLLEARGGKAAFPANGYQGDYIRDIAAAFEAEGLECPIDAAGFEPGVLPEDDEAALDALIAQLRGAVGEAYFTAAHHFSRDYILAQIRTDLEAFGVSFDTWFSELDLVEAGAVRGAVERLEDDGLVVKKDGARWFASSSFGDEKDRVVVRENGQSTYFASDLAYHDNKAQRAFDRIIDIWGADHHGYIKRVEAGFGALGHDTDKLEVLLVQFATLYRHGEKVKMTTRGGDFIELNWLVKEVGIDAARFFYVTRKSEQHLEFDIELARSQTRENPVYYIQYAHARICSVFNQLEERGYSWDRPRGAANLDRLESAEERDLVTQLAHYPELIVGAAGAREPHQVAHFLRDTAGAFHIFYDRHKLLVEDDNVRDARLNLIAATRQVLHNALAILGVSAPRSM
ncbi:MAG: arginine--tRNA ligase [Gammaproteobacteria bacterium]|nr:arginine--tRNA ligase [Gammaproteobacteria bacterium]